MAKGNVGNLLQHFVATRVAKRVVDAWGKPDEPIEFVDCFSMAPWEVTKTPKKRYMDGLTSMLECDDASDLTSAAFKAAYQLRYQDEFPTKAREREYPNTAVLLTAAFPNQQWRMRLHEVDEEKLEELSTWASEQTNIESHVNGAWRQSEQMIDNPVPKDRPVFVMLDPKQVVEAVPKANPGFFLTERSLVNICGELRLHFSNTSAISAPRVLTVFSYSEKYPGKSDRIVRKAFDNQDFEIENIRVQGQRAQFGQATHQGWVVSTGLPAPEQSLQASWDEWQPAMIPAEQA